MKIQVVAAISIMLFLAGIGAGYFIGGNINHSTTSTSSVTFTSTSTLTSTETLIMVSTSTIASVRTVNVATTVTSTETLGTPVPLVSVFDGNITIGSTPDTIAVNPTAGIIYVTGQSNALIVINATSHAVIANVTLPQDAGGGIAVDNKTGVVFVLLQAGVAEVNGTTNSVIGKLPLDFESRSMAFDSSTNTIYGSDGGYYLVGASAQTGAVTMNVSTRYSPNEVLVNPQNNLIYSLACNPIGLACDTVVSIVNGTSARLVNETFLGSPYYASAAIDETTGFVYVSGATQLAELNAMGTIIYRNYPDTCGPFTAMRVDSTQNEVIMAPQNYNYLLVYDARFGNLVNMYSLPGSPRDVAFNPETNETYVIVSNSLLSLRSAANGHIDSSLIGADQFCPLP